MAECGVRGQSAPSAVHTRTELEGFASAGGIGEWGLRWGGRMFLKLAAASPDASRWQKALHLRLARERLAQARSSSFRILGLFNGE